ncbi:peptidase M24 [Desulfonema ishimotonii]|uniref:Peptidase M24 n=1 Tax=Desulfonema ishimotonii TaxID=45657 RepID=A0A401FTK9_9BACT|nr:Xaa-Pro peptidase family protein [Desulfonema ishimotonii]GBC60299.1 peptidase M24 [Desulfonema ishimotonii]
MFLTDSNIPEPEIRQRIERFQNDLTRKALSGALILQKPDLYYFSGTIQDAHLYIPAQGNPVLMVRKSLERAASESPLERIVPMDSPGQLPDILKKNGHPVPRNMGLELDVLPASRYLKFQKIFPETALTDVSHLIRRVRAVKSDYEIGIIREAARLADQVFERVPELIAEGMTEVGLAGLIEAEARKRGHQGLVRMRLWGGELFYGHLMAGPSAAVPSFLASPTGGSGLSPAIAQSAGFRPIRKNEPILVDYVFVLNGYISDQTRIFALDGLSDSLMAAHEAMLDVQKTIMRTARPGTRAGELYGLAVERAAELGYGDNFMGTEGHRIRFVGHGVGLELDEYPFLARGQQMELEAGMVIALEPKVIFPGKGVVGIENTHLVTRDGLVSFSRFPDTVRVV